MLLKFTSAGKQLFKETDPLNAGDQFLEGPGIPHNR